MKKIEALKNKKTGDLQDYGDCVHINHDNPEYYKVESLGREWKQSKSEFTPTPCLLIEESELEEKIGEIQNELSMMVTMPNANEFDEGYIQASEEISKSVAKLLNSLTK